MNDLLTALALVIVIEGCAYALAPDLMRHAAMSMLEIPPNTLRWGGVIAAIVGVFAVWAIRS